MNLLLKIQRAFTRPWLGGWFLLPLTVLLLTLSGCGDSQIKSYRLTKDDAAPSLGQAQAAPVPMASPQLTWALPAGWKEVPASEMRAASFVVSGKDGQTAEVAAIPMQGGGSEVDLVNMWRQMMQLQPLTAEAAVKQAEPVMISSDQGKLFDIPSEVPIIEGKSRARILVATVTRGPTSWFFKMTGEAGFVNEQKPVFVQFLKSISFANTAAAQPMTMTDAKGISDAADPEKPVWTVPTGWQTLPPGQMLVAKFLVATNDGVRTEVNVGTAMGGTLANVNRWRGQLGLQLVGEDAMKSDSTAIDVDGGKAMVIDLSGTDARNGKPARILGVVVPRGPETWFYKIMGDPQVVEQQKAVFTKFVQTVKYPHAH